MAELCVLRGDETVYVHPIGASPVHLGRAPTNELVLSDARVSSRHLVVWQEADQLCVEDLGSRNGTRLNGTPLAGRAALSEGDVLELGDRVRIRVAGRPASASARLGAFVLEDRTSGIRLPVHADRIRIGGGPDDDLCIPGAPVRAATLVFHPDEVWLGTEDDERELAPGEAFEVAGHDLALIAASSGETRTEATETSLYRYHLAASLQGATGPTAVLTDGGLRHEVGAEQRVTLLWVLARQRATDVALPEIDRGWIHDDDVASALWGRERHSQEPNNLHVLVHRLRKELEAAGFDPWFLEKKRKHLRVRLDQLSVE